MRKLIEKTWKFQKYVKQFSAKRQSSKRHNGNGSDGMSHLDQFIITGKGISPEKYFRNAATDVSCIRHRTQSSTIIDQASVRKTQRRVDTLGI